MDATLRVVNRLPLKELWRDDGLVTSARGRSLTAEHVSELLRLGPLRFVVADVGLPPRWIQINDCYEFWKQEGKPHLAKAARVVLDEYPDRYCYFASEWSSTEESTSIVLLEKQH